jgi:hypothetical protein
MSKYSKPDRFHVQIFQRHSPELTKIIYEYYGTFVPQVGDELQLEVYEGDCEVRQLRKEKDWKKRVFCVEKRMIIPIVENPSYKAIANIFCWRV